MIAVRNTYYNYTGSACEIGYNNLNLDVNFVNWTSVPCQAKYSDCGYCGKFEFIVRWCDTTVFNYVFEFELDGPCGSQTFAVCNSNGPASCTYSSFMSGTTRIYDAVFHYTIDDDCCFVLSTECENILCAASSSDDCPINFECSPDE